MPYIMHREALCMYSSLIAPNLNEGDREYLIREMCDMYIDEEDVKDVGGDRFGGRIYRKGYTVLGSMAAGIQFDGMLRIATPFGDANDRMSVLVQRIDPVHASRN